MIARDIRLSVDKGFHRMRTSTRALCVGALFWALCATWSEAAARKERPPAPVGDVAAPAALDTPSPAATAPPPPSTPAPPPPPADAPMRAHYDYARSMFARQDYVAAAAAMERAYAREPRPMLLFNVGQAYRKAARYPEAVTAYQRFLEIAPQHPMALDARDHLRTITILSSQEDKRKQIELEMAETQQEIDRIRRPPIYKRVWFWAAILGGTAAVVAIGVGAKTYQDQRRTDSGLVTLEF